MQRTSLNRVEEEGKEDEANGIKSSKIEDGANLSPLHVAAIMGNRAKMALLLKEHKDDINNGDKIGRTPLMYSILGDRYDCAEVLIKSGADVNKVDVDERTALHWASYQGNQKFVKLLLDKGAKQGIQDKEGRTPLHLSLSHDNIKVMARLLKDTDVDCKDANGMTPLHFSVAYERVEHTKMLLHAKAAPDCQDNDKKTVLHWAKTNKDTTIISKLLDYERVMLILNSKDSEGRTALHLYVAVDNKQLVRYLTSREDCLLSEQDHMQRTPLHLAAILGHTEIAEVLLGRGCEALIPDNNGVRPLHYAAQNNFGKTLDAMLQHENVKDVPDNDGRTALMWAAAKGAYDALNVLISHKQDILATDCSDATALHMASEGGHLQCVTLLLQHQAGVNSLDDHQYTPLLCACQMGHRDVVETLLLRGATVDLEDKEGRTPLHWAAVGGRTDICAMLISHGIDVSKRDNLGRPALHYAAYGGFFSCMSLLLEYGSDVDARDNTGVTALHWACASGSLDAVKLLFRYNAFPNFVETEGDKLTPLDYAIFREHQDVAQIMMEQGAFTIAGIQEEAALVIQATWRGYRLRKSFQEQKKLFILHEKRRKETKLKLDTEEKEKYNQKKPKAQGTRNPSKDASKFLNHGSGTVGRIVRGALLEDDSSTDIIYKDIGTTLKNEDPQYQQILTYGNYLTNNSLHLNENDGVQNKANPADSFNEQCQEYVSVKAAREKTIGETRQPDNVDTRGDVNVLENVCSESNEKDGYGSDNELSLSNASNEDSELTLHASSMDKIKANSDRSPIRTSLGRTNKDFQKKEDTTYDKNLLGKATGVQDVTREAQRERYQNVEENKTLKSAEKRMPVTKKGENFDVIQTTSSIYKALHTPSTSSSFYSYDSNADLKPWQIYQRERHRKYLIRRKIESAVVIQRAFRTHLSKSRPEDDDRLKRAEKQTEARDRRIMEDIAALLIQLHWRKYMKRKLMQGKVQENHSDKKGRETPDSRLLSARERKPKVALHPRAVDTTSKNFSPTTGKQKSSDVNTIRTQNDDVHLPNILNNTNIEEKRQEKGSRDKTNDRQMKTRPRTDGSNSRRGSRSGEKILLAPAKHNRFNGGHNAP